MKKHLILLSILVIVSACKKTEKRKIVDSAANISEVEKDLNTVDIADLPVYIDSTNYLIHPIGIYRITRQRSEYFSSDNFASGSYSVSNYSSYKIAGDLSNVKFQHIDSNELKPITGGIMSIRAMSFLYDLFTNTKVGFYVYEVIDKDTNADGKLTTEDLKSLYLSNSDGTNFKKLSLNSQDLVTWKSLEIKRCLYFKTIENIDNNGVFDKKDKVHYFYLNLLEDNAEVQEYQPV